MAILDILTAMENSALGVAVRENALFFPWLESIHIVSVTIVVGVVIVIDARLMGFASKDERATKLTNELTPVIWAAFAVAFLTGGIMFFGTPVKYFNDIYFQLKMLFLAAAAVNMAVFHKLTWKGADGWDNLLPPPQAVRAAGAVSAALWLLIIAMGRIVGFSLN